MELPKEQPHNQGPSHEKPTYESPEIIELGSIEALTWTGSADTFTIST